jgi:hypothetical protein
VSVAIFIHPVNLTFMCRIVLQSAGCLAALPFGILFDKRHELRISFIEYKLFVPNLYTVLSQTFLILRRIYWSIIITVNRLSCKLLVFFWEFIRTWFCREIFEFLKYKISWKFVRSEPSSSKRTDGRTVGQTRLTKQIVALRYLRNASKGR